MAISSVLGSSALLPAGLGFRNVLINGGFDVWQRGTTAAIPSSVGTSYLADRWSAYRPAVGSTQSRVTAGLDGFQYALRIQRDNGNTGTGIIYMNQSFETSTMVKLANKQVTLSFYARAGANYSSASSLFNARVVAGTGTEANVIHTGVTGSTEPLVAAVALTTSWQRFTVTGLIPSGTNGGGVYFFYTPTGTAGANDYVDITGVQLEQNYQPTPFEQRPIGIELGMCQRYYCVVASGSSFVGNAVMHTTDAFESVIHLPTVMRTAPTLIATTGASYYGIYALNVTKRVDLLTNASNNPSNLRIYGSLVSTTSTAGVGAGLYLQSASASIAASAEL